MMNSQCQIKQEAEAVNPDNSQRFTAKDKLFNTRCHHLNSGQCFCPSNMAQFDVKKLVECPAKL